jgi:hypothetical protein
MRIVNPWEMLNNGEKRHLNRTERPSPPNTSAVHRFNRLFFARFPDERVSGRSSTAAYSPDFLRISDGLN